MAYLVPIFLSLVLAQRAAAQVFGPPFNNTNGSSGSSTGAGLVVGVTFAALAGCIAIAFILIAVFTSDCCRKNHSAPPAHPHRTFMKHRPFSGNSWHHSGLEAQHPVGTLGYGHESPSHAVDTTNTEYPPANAPLPPPPYRNNSNQGATDVSDPHQNATHDSESPPAIEENVDAPPPAFPKNSHRWEFWGRT
ncbi:uncharacterized protein LACBIDRAFT_328678 [Laccaria bicolor S238N-H82]|uniref:Predicted protein n=1 Tax=Laccaria bicolor (strain S238N-H82 / ATCC MYA-4686) TaxID=486041 RepID=B0DFN1_LACBS|nr:uncharacterized protein LACBIDRAFT_328678 [Laccaria bicolor S238N-H82]EDR06491.1 predicted protein [Laccaria bicolor S238N-H82]|eukprot:XP_001882863.1 predicted protein [Laccaria bicolor S238N-H82]